MPVMSSNPESGSGARTARSKCPPAAIAVTLPLVPSRPAGGADASPQQTTPWVLAWIAHPCTKPAEMALAVPLVPSTDGGGVEAPEVSSPQQTTAPPVWIAQL